MRYTRDFSLAVVEAKAGYKKPGDGLQQAKEYAGMLGLKLLIGILMNSATRSREPL